MMMLSISGSSSAIRMVGLRSGIACLYLQRYREAFRRCEHVDVRALQRRPAASAAHQAIHGAIDASRVVMVERQPLHAARHGEVDRVLDAAVPPPDLLAELFGRVLRIGNQEVGAADELHEAA